MDDRIESSTEIRADIERVWELVSEPGWWINSGVLGRHRIERTGDECIVHDDELGAFPVGIIELSPPYRAVFSWHPGGDDVPRTTVEFTLTTTQPDIVTVTVVETGFARMTAEQHRRNYGANRSGWRSELALARTNIHETADADLP